MNFTDWIDKCFELWNSDFGVHMYGIGIICCILALFLRLVGARKS